MCAPYDSASLQEYSWHRPILEKGMKKKIHIGG